jgi:hypothetical protein
MKTPLKLSNLWENFEQVIDGVQGDDILVWLFTKALQDFDKPPPIVASAWGDLCRNILINFENDGAFRAIFTGYTEGEREAIRAALEIRETPGRGLGVNSNRFRDRMLQDLNGQNYHGIVFGTGRTAAQLPDPTDEATKANWSMLVSGLASAQKRLRERKTQYRGTGAKTGQLGGAQKAILRGLTSDVDKILRQMESFKYNQKGMRKACRDAGLQPATFNSSGMVKGWGNWSRGYSVTMSDYMPEKIDLYQISKDEFAKVLTNLISAGFKISSSSEPDKAINGDRVATITVEQFHSDAALDTKVVELNEASKFDARPNNSRMQAKVDAHDQFGACGVCGGELINQKQAKAGKCDECA